MLTSGCIVSRSSPSLELDSFGRSRLHSVATGWPHSPPTASGFISTTQGLDTDASNPCAKLMLTLLAGVAEFERELIIERTVAGIEAARKRSTTRPTTACLPSRRSRPAARRGQVVEGRLDRAGRASIDRSRRCRTAGSALKLVEPVSRRS